MKCKNCKKKDAVKYSKYSNGEFCSKKCARGFSTKAKRKEINEKVSESLTGKKLTDEHKKNISLSLTGTTHKGKWKSYGPGSPSAIKQSNTLRRINKEKKEKAKKELPLEKWKKPWIFEFIFNEVGNHCEKCGYEYINEEGKGPFEIHHKDGNHDNWKRENLEVLCLNCHWKTPNWRFRGGKQTEESIEKMLITSMKKGLVKKIHKNEYKYLNNILKKQEKK